MPLRMNLDIARRLFGEIDIVVPRRPLDVCEREVTIGFADAFDLIETGHGVAHMTSIGQRFFALFREREDAVGKIALARQAAVSFVWFPSSSHDCFFPHLRPNMKEQGSVRRT